ncbi:MAG: methyltransferase domain-containing protein [Candidatus Margulisiibacteriota bacterium]|nr:methyltransferase domain-containing protein [Candidatus Margulisiibacteriota bacterium]
MAKTKKCRICGNDFFNDPLLCYKNMPKAAQYLPDKNALKNDHGIDLEVYQCSGCGLVQLSNKPVPYYKEVIRAAGISDEMMAFRKRQFADLLEKYSLKGKKVIEIGCGCGEYLSIMRQAGADACGLEQSAESVSKCVEKGLKADQGFIQDNFYKLEGAPFNAFCMLNFLEHLPDPNSILKGISFNLVGGGMGLVEVPNFDMILRNNLFSEFIGDHLLYFTRDTLNTALKLNGFDIIECNEVWHNYIISAVVKKNSLMPSKVKTLGKSERLDLSHFNKYQSKLKAEIEAFIHRNGNRKVAIWGAGHQALAVIALTKLAGKIRYVVDSAAFKQGKYTPASHIPIVKPDTLRSNPVDAIIVIAASYSDEVAKIIQQKYAANIKVAILRDNGLEII